MDSSEDQEPGGVSRRGFLRGLGGSLGAAGLLPALLPREGAAAEDPPTRKGVKRIPAGGAKIMLNVNGRDEEIEVTPATTLLEALREKMALTGAKEICDRGACGGCTVLVDGRSVNSCLMLAVAAIGRKVTTAEGLARGEKLDPLQQAFCEHDACQCGYCIPGFVVRARALLDEIPNPTQAQIRDGLSGNICRCAAYVRIFDAVAADGKGGAS